LTLVLEAAIREQRLDSMRESSGTLPTSGVFVPFGDVVKRFSWTPDASVSARRGIGSVDALEHDTGLESHSCMVAYLLQGSIAQAATLETGDSTGTVAADQIRWTADKLGHDGNEITVTLIAGTADAGGISVIDKDIVCEVGTALADDLVTLLNADSQVAALVTCATTSVTSATGTVQVAGIATLNSGVSTPFSEALYRDDDGQVEARTIVLREKHYEGGTADYGLRTYVVLEGAKPGTARLAGDPGAPGPMEVEINYTAEKGRQYEISQPSTACVLLVVSSETATDNGNATLTVEDDDGNQEAIVVGGTGSALYESIDAMELDADCTGTLTVLQGSTAGATLAVIYGKTDYANAEGDTGVPILPTSGSRTATLGTSYEKFLGDTIEYGSGGTLAYTINSAELSVDNSIETQPRNDSRKQRVIEGNRVLQLTATVLGEAEYQRQITRHLQVTTADIIWTLTNSTLTLEGAALTSVGDKSIEEGGAYMQLNNTFEGTAITIA